MDHHQTVFECRNDHTENEVRKISVDCVDQVISLNKEQINSENGVSTRCAKQSPNLKVINNDNTIPQEKNKTANIDVVTPEANNFSSSTNLAKRNDNSSGDPGLFTVQSRFFGSRVRKFFKGHGWFSGTVISFDEDLRYYLVRYEDGDTEEIYEPNLMIFLVKTDDKDNDKAQNIYGEDTSLSLVNWKLNTEQKLTSIFTKPAIFNSSNGVSSRTPIHDSSQGVLVGKEVRKLFENHGWYNGNILSYDEYYGLYLVLYEDGDKEELEEYKVRKILVDRAIKKRSIKPGNLSKNAHVNEYNCLSSGENRHKKLDLTTDTGTVHRRENESSKKPEIAAFQPQLQEKNPPQESLINSPQKIQIGSKVRKYFKDYGWFKGSVVTHSNATTSYLVRYEDGDTEELTDKMLKKILVVNASHPLKIPVPVNSKRKLEDLESGDRNVDEHNLHIEKINTNHENHHTIGDACTLTIPIVTPIKSDNMLGRGDMSNNYPGSKSLGDSGSLHRPNFVREIKNHSEAALIEKKPPSGFLTENGASYVGRRVARIFAKDRIYYGNVEHFSSAQINELGIDLWTVRYLDGDKEDLNKKELGEALEWAQPARLNRVGIEFAHFLHYRMTVWMQHYPKRAEKETMCNKVTRKGIHKSTKFSWKLASCAKMGNAYRHLDTGTQRFGEMVRIKVGGSRTSDPTKWTMNEIEQSVIMGLMKMTGFRPEILRTFFKNWENLPLEACFPSTLDELDILTCKLRQIQQLSTRPTLFHGKFQTQGFRWIDYFDEFTPALLTLVVTEVMSAKTWGAAVLALQKFPGVGSYSAAQSLCDIFMGVWRQKRGLFNKHDDVVASMSDETGIGPGPIHSLKKIFPTIGNKENALKILRESIGSAFEEEGLDFPYLKDKNGQLQQMSCVDLEHSLCYFHRYLVSKQNMGEEGIDILHNHFNEPLFKQKVPLPSIKQLELHKKHSVSAWCEKRYLKYSGNELGRIDRRPKKHDDTALLQG
eukprot:CAMPEP_0194249184 /NCGR_PEP_ID=MMETSP0158-20130606/19884_1 /TAXON_ID=33649 /ORGANISM="Thalassionema nitzschioides, Strain L26-B" /LENGTH=988 /DNA_ID=CAMNT_0038985645 /DNA_START=194 /DNA_END=3160 /DNA_ORIENTATION=-